jgi:hypothetical protein
MKDLRVVVSERQFYRLELVREMGIDNTPTLYLQVRETRRRINNVEYVTTMEIPYDQLKEAILSGKLEKKEEAVGN